MLRRLLLALGISVWLTISAFAQTVGPTNTILCNKTASVAIATATTTSLVSGIAGQAIMLCGWHVTSTQSATSTFQLEYGTQGGPCTTPTTITPAFNVTNTAPSADHIEYAHTSLPTATQLCVVTTGGT